MKFLSLVLLLLVSLNTCSNAPFEPFEFFYSITGEQAVILSLLPGNDGVEMRTRVYPEDGLIGIGEVPARDGTRLLSAQEAGQVQELFRAVQFQSLGSDTYIPPLDASVWAVNTRETVDDYYTVLEPGEAVEERGLGDLIELGTYLWRLADLRGNLY
ncbi:MAG: hypothetical protein KDI29_07810 [Pseudomonadales bacterium]|nr:hypothetical protein [Pseudomonadales bacterium]